MLGASLLSYLTSFSEVELTPTVVLNRESRQWQSMVFTRQGPSVLDTWPLDGWGEAHSLTNPSQLDDNRRPRLLLGDTPDSRAAGSLGPGSRGVLYRIMNEDSGVVIDIGETNVTIESRQTARFREHRWEEYARIHPTCIQVLVPVNGRISRQEGEAVHLRNYVNIHGSLPHFNSKTERPRLRPDQWIAGIRQLARDFGDDEYIGIRNITTGSVDEPNEVWSKLYPKVCDVKGITEELQVLINQPSVIKGNIMGFSGKCYYLFSNRKIRKNVLLYRIPNSSLYVRESGEIGYWDGTKAVDLSTELMAPEDADFLQRVVDYSLRTHWG